MKRSFIFLLGLLCIIMVEAKNHYFKHLGVSDGLSQVCIFSIYQDELGAVWLGTSEGLNRYNGKDVKIFRPSQGNEGLTNNEINKRLSGNFWLVSFKISYLCLPLFYETRTTPSCHPSGCAYRQL